MAAAANSANSTSSVQLVTKSGDVMIVSYLASRPGLHVNYRNTSDNGSAVHNFTGTPAPRLMTLVQTNGTTALGDGWLIASQGSLANPEPLAASACKNATTAAAALPGALAPKAATSGGSAAQPAAHSVLGPPGALLLLALAGGALL